MNDPLARLLEALVIPGGVTLLTLVALACLSRGRGSRWWPGALPVAIIAGFIAGLVAMQRATIWWPAPNLRLAHVGVAALFASMLVMAVRARRPGLGGLVAFLIPVLMAGAGAAMLLGPLARYAWTGWGLFAAALGAGVAAGAWSAVLERSVAGGGGWASLAAVGVVAGGSAGAILLTGNAFYAQASGILGVALVVAAGTAAAAGGAGVGCGRRGLACPGVGAGVGVTLACLWAAAWGYAEAPVPVVGAVLVVLAPLATGLGLVPAIARGPGLRSAVVQGLGGAVLVGLGTLVIASAR